jgi:hypothetical protein
VGKGGVDVWREVRIGGDGSVGMATGTEYPCARGQKPDRVRVWV